MEECASHSGMGDSAEGLENASRGIPGQEAEDIRVQAHSICKEYLTGTWAKVQPSELIIKKISGGLSNLLFYISLPAERGPQGQEPARVLLRLYGQLHGQNASQQLVQESVIFTLLSESHKGPRLFGVFPGGRLEEFIPARPLCTQELSDPELSDLIADKMAQIHAMNVPISKEPEWLWNTMDRWIQTILEFLRKPPFGPLSAMAEELRQFDLVNELKWLRSYLVNVGSPVVFCHNDLQEGNILLRESPGHREIVIIDYEYCSYNYRGFDFANHLCEWMYDYSNTEPPYFWIRQDNAPTQEQQERLVRRYLGADCGEDAVRRLLAEVDAFKLAVHFFWSLWSVVNASVSHISFDYWSFGKTRLEAYLQLKCSIEDTG